MVEKMSRNILLFAVFSVASILLLSGCTSNNPKNNSGNNSDTEKSWLDTYTPIHAVGTGSNNFWISYPTSHPNASQPVDHLPWVLNSLHENAVIFVVHRTGCVTCQPQADRMIALAEKYEDNVTFYDLDITLGGETEQKAYEAYVYDPAGPPGYIALSVLVAVIEVNGEIEYGWHSWEGDVADEELESWVRDTIYYYHINSGN
jgi:thiol-disulfide isomerase/thioredoxin